MGFWLRSLEETPEKRPLAGWLYESAPGRGRAALFSRDLAPDDIFLFHPRRALGGDVYEVAWPIPEPVAAASVAPEVLPEPVLAVPSPAAAGAIEPSAAPVEAPPVPGSVLSPEVVAPVPEPPGEQNAENAERAVIAAMAAVDVAALVVPSQTESEVPGQEAAPEAAPQAETTDRV